MARGSGSGVTRSVLSARAEAAGTELMYTLAAHERWRRSPIMDYGRLKFLRTFSAPDSIEHLTVPHIAAVAEEFAHATLLEASEPLVPQTHAILKQLWRHAETQIEQWNSLADAWAKWHGINMKTEPQYQRLQGVVDARNAIVHGLGRLTRKQTRADGGAAVRANLARVGITTSGTSLVINDESVKRSVHAARAFIEWLDRESIDKGLRPLQSVL